MGETPALTKDQIMDLKRASLDYALSYSTDTVSLLTNAQSIYNFITG
jgi:hypothetical protein